MIIKSFYKENQSRNLETKIEAVCSQYIMTIIMCKPDIFVFLSYMICFDLILFWGRVGEGMWLSII